VAQRIRSPKSAEIIANHVRRQIVTGELREGDSMPGESILTLRYNVSRPTLREAFRILESESLISVQRGARGGAVVRTPTVEAAARYAGLVLQRSRTSIADVFEARAFLEAPAVGRLARAHSDEHVERLRAVLDAGDLLIDDPAAMLANMADFHYVLIELMGNQTLQLLSAMIEQIIIASQRAKVSASRGRSDPAMNLRSHRAHRRLVDMIAGGRAEEAEEYWRRHILEANEFLLGNVDATTIVELFD
jgi:DNA-binding FadR family transcriptional regulator